MQVTMIFLVLKLYKIIDRPFDDYDGVFHSVETAAGVAALMILLGAYARIGTDDMWNHIPLWRSLSGFAAYVLSLVCLVLLLVDLTIASDGKVDGFFLRSFFYVWIGYPLVALVSILWRLVLSRSGTYKGEYPEKLSILKDVSYGLLDVWSKGVFAMWTAYSVFVPVAFE